MDVLGRAALARDRNAALEAVERATSIEDQQRQEINKLLRAEKMLLTATRRKLREEKHV